MEPHLKFRRETVETERENINLKTWQRCPQQCWKTRLRKPSGGIWRTADAASGNAVSRLNVSSHERPQRSPAPARFQERKRRQRSSQSRNRQVEGKGQSACRGSPDQPPDGTGRRRGGRAMKAGSFGNHRDADPDRVRAARPTEGQGKANGKGDRPKSTGHNAGERGAGGNVGPICFWGIGEYPARDGKARGPLSGIHCLSAACRCKLVGPHRFRIRICSLCRTCLRFCASWLPAAESSRLGAICLDHPAQRPADSSWPCAATRLAASSPADRALLTTSCPA